MKISREARRAARELFRLTLVNGRVDAGRTKEISDRLVAERPRGYFEILKEFTRLVRLELSKRHAVIESAAELDAATVAEITGNLRKKFGDDITTEFHVNPSLIGGLRVKLGSDVWDGSIRSRLASLVK
jgi:F0F1-type ATP synthase, delta subunit (mitochondrial oligomycin sensitivity protein)